MDEAGRDQERPPAAATIAASNEALIAEASEQLQQIKRTLEESRRVERTVIPRLRARATR
jgi:hypothetical protein